MTMSQRKVRMSKVSEVVETDQEYIMRKLDIKKGMSINRAIVNVSAMIDDQHDPGRFANGIIQRLNVPLSFTPDINQSKILALAVVEQLLTTDTFDPASAADIAVEKLRKMSKKLPFLFKTPLIDAPKKRGSKRDAATKLYLDNKHLPSKEIISIITNELDVSPQNAYTYVYLIKKSLKV